MYTCILPLNFYEKQTIMTLSSFSNWSSQIHVPDTLSRYNNEDTLPIEKSHDKLSEKYPILRVVRTEPQ